MYALSPFHITCIDGWPSIHKTLCPSHKHSWNRCFYFAALPESFSFLLHTLIKRMRSLVKGDILWQLALFYFCFLMCRYCMRKWGLSCRFHSKLIFPVLAVQRTSGDSSRKPFLQARRPVFILVACPKPWWTRSSLSSFHKPTFSKNFYQDGPIGQNKGLSESLPYHCQLSTPKEKSIYHCTLQIFSLQLFEE